MYGRLRSVEDDMAAGRMPASAAIEALDALDAQVLKVSVPLAYADELYALRNHIQLVRKKVPDA